VLTLVALLAGGVVPLVTAGSADAALVAGAPRPPTAAPVVVGNGRPGRSATGDPAEAASLSGPTGVALDGAGDLFVADTGNCRIVEVPARSTRPRAAGRVAGHLYVVAGDGCGHAVAPAGTPADRSGVGFAQGVAVDRSGDLFIADTSGNRLLVVAGSTGTRFGRSLKAGDLYTLAGTGVPGFGGDGGPAGRAELDGPDGVGVDASGDVFVADTANCRVREVPVAGGPGRWVGPLVAGHIYTVAGSGRCGTPLGAGADGDGGPAVRAVVWGPTAVASDPAGDLFIADRGDDEVREVAAVSGSHLGVSIGAGDIATVAGTGAGYGPYLADGLSATGATAGLNFPDGVALDEAGDLFVADGDDRAVREVLARSGGPPARPGAAGDMTTVIGALLAGPAQDGTRWVLGPVVSPWGVAVDAAGAVYFSDRGANVVRVVRPG
jgi:sugar lactone lactonase YvrE